MKWTHKKNLNVTRGETQTLRKWYTQGKKLPRNLGPCPNKKVREGPPEKGDNISGAWVKSTKLKFIQIGRRPNLKRSRIAVFQGGGKCG